MSTTSTSKPDFVPVESIIAFAFIGCVILVGLIARCLALNHSTTRNAQSLDLVIYKEAPRPAPVQKQKRPSTEQHTDANGDNRNQRTSQEDSMAPARIQRGPKVF